MRNTWDDIQEELAEGEVIEAVLFGKYGWDGFGEKEIKNPIPENKIGIVLTPEEAKPLMAGWSVNGRFGSPACYALNVWTNMRILWVTQYDGATWLDSAKRNPENYLPSMPGG